MQLVDLVPDRNGAQRGEAEDEAHVEEHLEEHLRVGVDSGPSAGGVAGLLLMSTVSRFRASHDMTRPRAPAFSALFALSKCSGMTETRRYPSVPSVLCRCSASSRSTAHIARRAISHSATPERMSSCEGIGHSTSTTIALLLGGGELL